MTDRYRSFSELAGAEEKGRNWTLDHVDRGSDTLILAPHGGWIEPYTAELAMEIAGADFSWYAFRGLKPEDNQSLHLTSHRFDEPVALAAVGSARWAVAVHGEKTRKRRFVMIGGLWAPFREAASASLQTAGFTVEVARAGLRGVHPRNICNRGRAGRGGQLELSEALRRSLRHDDALRTAFVDAVRKAVVSAEGKEDPPGHPGTASPDPGVPNPDAAEGWE